MSNKCLLILVVCAIAAAPVLTEDFNGRVFLNVPLKDMVAEGYTMIMNEPYAHITSPGYIQSIRDKCTNETRLCVGGADAVTLTLQLVACGNCYVITSTTAYNTPVEENGVYWYFTPDRSFGFSPLYTINQAAADTLSVRGAERLSWPTLVAGYRIGSTLGAAAERKIMFMKNAPVPAQKDIGVECVYGVECASGICDRKKCSVCPSNERFNNSTQMCEVIFTEFNGGVFVNVLVNEMALKGYAQIMDQAYSHITSDAYLQTIRAQCNNETRLCVGGANAVAVTLQLVACGNCYAVTTPTALNIPVMENGVYWYYTPLTSFGFSPLIGVHQAAADLLMTTGEHRLSWPTQTGGFRIGNTLGAAAEHKMMFIKN